MHTEKTGVTVYYILYFYLFININTNFGTPKLSFVVCTNSTLGENISLSFVFVAVEMFFYAPLPLNKAI